MRNTAKATATSAAFDATVFVAMGLSSAFMVTVVGFVLATLWTVVVPSAM